MLANAIRNNDDGRVALASHRTVGKHGCLWFLLPPIFLSSANRLSLGSSFVFSYWLTIAHVFLEQWATMGNNTTQYDSTHLNATDVWWHGETP